MIDDRIGAREMLGHRKRGQPRRQPHCVDHGPLRRRSSSRSWCRSVPVQHRLGLARAAAGGPGAARPLDGDRAQIDDEQIVARLQGFGARRRDAIAEARSAVKQAEEHRLGGGRKRARLSPA